MCLQNVGPFSWLKPQCLQYHAIAFVKTSVAQHHLFGSQHNHTTRLGCCLIYTIPQCRLRTLMSTLHLRLVPKTNTNIRLFWLQVLVCQPEYGPYTLLISVINLFYGVVFCWVSYQISTSWRYIKNLTKMGNPFNIKMSLWGTKIFIWQIGWFHVSIPELYWNVARNSWSSLDSLYRYDFHHDIVIVYPGTYILNLDHQHQTIYKRRQSKTGIVKSYLMEMISVYSPEYEYTSKQNIINQAWQSSTSVHQELFSEWQH